MEAERRGCMMQIARTAPAALDKWRREQTAPVAHDACSSELPRSKNDENTEILRNILKD